MTNTPDKSELLPCPFCGSPAERITIGEDEPNNAGGDVITCTRCQASSHVEFGRKENLVARWNSRASSRPADQVPDMVEMKLADLHKAVAAEFPSDEFVFSRQRAIDLALAVHMKIAALQAVPAASEVGWRPIESAPKDGTWVLGYFGDTAGDDPSDMCVCCFHRGKWVDDQHDELGALDEPTHWCALPEPPALKASGEE